jgi:hypothetical protein
MRKQKNGYNLLKKSKGGDIQVQYELAKKYENEHIEQ